MEKNPVTKDQKAAAGGLLIRRLRAVLFGTALCLVSATAFGQIFEQRQFQNPEQERRYREIISELRCLVCQNQNLADSNAPLAADLRNIVFDMIQNGKDDDEIREFMVNRYGDFVLYRPPFSAKNVALWAGPFVLLVIGLWLLLRQIHRRAAAAPRPAQLSDADRERLKSMLGERPDEKDEARGP